MTDLDRRSIATLRHSAMLIYLESERLDSISRGREESEAIREARKKLNTLLRAGA